MPHILSKIPEPDQHRIKVISEKQFEDNCSRCGGLLVRDWCDNILDSGMLKIPIQRCIQCGDIIDSVILQHRCLPTCP